MVMECSYAVTAWTQAVEDEHRLLSQVLAILFAYPQLPQDSLNGRLVNGSAAVPHQGPHRSGQGREVGLLERGRRPVQGLAATTWSGSSVESGAKRERGPEVRTQTIRTSLSDAPKGRTVLEMHRSVGTVRDKNGEPLPDVWITLPDVGTWASSDPRAGFASIACRRARTGCWRAPPTAARPTRDSKYPEPASTSSIDGKR